MISEMFLKNVYFSDVKVLLRPRGVQIPAQVFNLPHGPPLGLTIGPHVKVY
jgi:hypothetical protein